MIQTSAGVFVTFLTQASFTTMFFIYDLTFLTFAPLSSFLRGGFLIRCWKWAAGGASGDKRPPERQPVAQRAGRAQR